jgi:predicted dehydrogenase
MSYTLVFERASVDFDLSRGAEALRIVEDGKPPHTVPCSGDGYVGEIRHLVDAIQSGRAPTVVTARDGLGAVEICEAEERSVRSGQWEIVPPA